MSTGPGRLLLDALEVLHDHACKRRKRNDFYLSRLPTVPTRTDPGQESTPRALAFSRT
jgi:hypothetical protein